MTTEAGKSTSHRRQAGFGLLLVLLAMLLMAALFLMAGQAQAQTGNRQYSSYITPFPGPKGYKVLVLGDSLGEGLWYGVTKAFEKHTRIKILNRAKAGTGFTRIKHIGRPREYEPMLAAEKPDIVVITVGAKDALAPIREDRMKHPNGSARWREIYSQRIGQFLRRLRRDNIAVYWVGLPIMRDTVFNENMNTINEVFRERAHVASIKFIDTWNGFVDQYGNFSPFGPDLGGHVVRLRSKDGIRFTKAGYRKLAHYVVREIRRDLKAARLERNVQLAGNPDEQLEINRKKSAKSELTLLKDADTTPLRTPAARAKGSDAMFGEAIASDRSSGLTLLSSVTRTNDPSLTGGRHTLPLNLRPYYRVLVKGEALSAKPGRADHFQWSKTR